MSNTSHRVSFEKKILQKKVTNFKGEDSVYFVSILSCCSEAGVLMAFPFFALRSSSAASAFLFLDMYRAKSSTTSGSGSDMVSWLATESMINGSARTWIFSALIW